MTVRVTEALRLAGLCPGFDYVTEFGMERGRATHAAIALDLTGRLDESSIHPEVAPRLASFRAWRDAAGFRASSIEVEVQGVGYVGHYDAVGMIAGVHWLLDWKNGSAAHWHAVQTALYAAAVGLHPIRRGTVYLRDDGGIARLVEHTDRGDLAVGRAAVAVATWKKSRGLLT